MHVCNFYTHVHISIYMYIFISGTEEFSSGIPPDDLSVLRGCVSRNRALFSPTLSVDTASVQLGGIKSTATWPDLIAHEYESHSLATRQNTPDDTRNSEPNLDCPVSVPYSVSIQFGRVGCNEEQSLPGLQKSNCHQSNFVGGCQLNPVSWSIPGRLNSPSLRPFRMMSHTHSSCSCAAYVSEIPLRDPQHFQNIPFVRTNSLDRHSSTRPFYSSKKGNL